MSEAQHYFTAYVEGLDLSSFDCGHDEYDQWLTRHAATAVRAGTAGVYLLIERTGDRERVVGYHAIAPTSVVRQELPRSAGGGAPDPVPAFLIARLALDRSHQGDKVGRWGTQLIVDALRRILGAATVSGGRIIVVDADNADLVRFYREHDFLPTGSDELRLYMKVSTARKAVTTLDAG